MAEKDISQKFILKNIHETGNYCINKIDQNELMIKKHKKVWTTLNYLQHFFILAFPVTWCISISVFPSLLGISIGIANSTIGLKFV